MSKNIVFEAGDLVKVTIDDKYYPVKDHYGVIEYIDGTGQIHLDNLGIAVIPDVDKIELVDDD